ncbi:unnamed protein product [Cochlearia groenlandica]
MGKSWLACVSVSCLSPGKDKKHQKEEKEKKKLYEKQKSRESIEFAIEETPPPSSSVSQPSPPLPDFSPQPSLPPPSPLLTSSSYKGYVGDSKEARNTRQALFLASVVAEEAAFVAANAAAEVMRLATSTHQIVESKEDVAAIKIQSLYRCYKARRALRVLQGMARLQALLQGKYVKRQMNAMLSSMQTLTRLQIQIHERRSRLSEENKDRHRLIQQKSHQKEQQNHSLVIAGDFDSSNKSKKQVEAKIANRKEASVRRERALAYAYSHQQTWRNSTKLPHQTLMDANTPHWGWSWLERWMDSRPWDPQSNDDQAFHKREEHSTKASPARSNKTLKSSSSQKSIQWPTNNESQKVEGSNRRHSIGGGSSTSVNDEESIGSSSSRRSSLGNTASVSKPVKKPKASVGPKGNLGNTESSKSKASMGAKGNLGNTQYVQKKKVVSDHNKKPPQVVLPKKRLSSSTSKKLLDSDKAVTTGEKKRRNGTST